MVETTNQTPPAFFSASVPQTESCQEAAPWLLHARQQQAGGDLSGALETLEQLIHRYPLMTELWGAIAEVLLEMGDLETALDCLRQALLIDGNDVNARVVLGTIQQRLGNLPAAEGHYRFALQAQPDHVVALGNLASILRSSGDQKQALVLTGEAHRLAPSSPQVAFNYGNLLAESGQMEAAREKFLAALPHHPRPAKVLHNLMETMKGTETDRPALSEWQHLAAARATSVEDQVYLHFAQGKIADDLKDYDTAFAHYRRANDLLPDTFDIAAHRQWIDQTTQAWSADFLNARAAWGNATAAPVFIVGMPRSGTTLVEQILSAHSQVQACGERTAVWDQVVALGESLGCGMDTHSTALRCTEADVHEFAENYLNVTGRDDRPFFTDKMPTNFLHLGWIALCFPEARIIHCRRDLRDVCLSCYFQHFTTPLPFANRLETLAAYAEESVRLMNHWHSVLPGRIIDVTYEQLVASPESEIRRLLKACDLSEEPGCFEPHKTQRSVSTASAWQVRQPIYQSSRRRWENYREHIQPLLDLWGDE